MISAERNIHGVSPHIDGLTGLPNKLGLNLALDDLSNVHLHGRFQTAVLMMDIDDLGTINSMMGEELGDQVIVDVANRVRSILPLRSYLYRFNGDCFALVIQVKRRAEAERLAQSCINLFSEALDVGARKLHVSVSIGVACFSLEQKSFKKITSYAESAMKKAKSQGRNRMVPFSSEMHREAHEKLIIRNLIPEAIKNSEFRLCYQPIIDFKTNKVVRAEALIRWESPVLGNVPPDKFISIAERTGDIIAIGDWICREACRVSQLLSMGCDQPPVISINVSPVQFLASNISATLMDAMDFYQIDSKNIAVEITEGLMIEDKTLTLKQLSELSEQGVTIYLDDFGTGYSSLSYLATYPVDVIKIDRSFIRTIEEDVNAKKLVSSIIALADKLDLNVIAEGIETPEQAAILSDQGCDLFQGFLYHKAMEEGAFLSLLAKSN